MKEGRGRHATRRNLKRHRLPLSSSLIPTPTAELQNVSELSSVLNLLKMSDDAPSTVIIAATSGTVRDLGAGVCLDGAVFCPGGWESPDSGSLSVFIAACASVHTVGPIN